MAAQAYTCCAPECFPFTPTALTEIESDPSRCKIISGVSCSGNGDPDMMKGLGTWSPAAYLNVTTAKREDSRWLVTIFGGEHACCPLCGVQSHSRHSFYSRTLGDLSAQGTPVTVRVRVGRWRCRNRQCDRQIFAERLRGVAGPFARQTDRLAEIVRLFGHSAGGRPSERLMARLGMRTSRTTILRRVKQRVRRKKAQSIRDPGRRCR
jgi:zinc-finger of transposase IS204/IS1001/IS1096/IS1165